MPLKLLLDENLRNDGLWLAMQTRNTAESQPLDIVRVGDADATPCASSDPEIIHWAAVHGRLLVSLDKTTLPRHLHEYLDARQDSPGIVLLPGGLPIPYMVDLLFLIAFITESVEWANACRWIP